MCVFVFCKHGNLILYRMINTIFGYTYRVYQNFFLGGGGRGEGGGDESPVYTQNPHSIICLGGIWYVR